MFTSRFKKILMIVFFLAILVLLFMFTPLKNIFTSFITPLENGASKISRSMEGNQEESEIDSLNKQIQELTAENNKLSSLREENKRLRSLLNMQENFSEIPTVGADIIAKDAGNWFSVFSVNVGKDEGIQKNFPVLNGDGLIGRTVDVGRNWAKVVSILDASHAMTGLVARTGDLVMIEGDITLMKSGLCKMTTISEESQVVVGDIVETSGIGGVYPKGIVIGTVQEFREDESGKGNYAIIKPAADLERLHEVLVMQMPEDWIYDFEESEEETQE